MEELQQEETSRLSTLLLEDDVKRDRKNFVYAFGILKRVWIWEYSVWPMPNVDVRKVIEGKINLDDIPYEDQNEIEKGMLFEEQRQFIAQYMREQKQMFCEAINYEPCLRGECPLFRIKNTKAGGLHGICSEYKTAFKNS